MADLASGELIAVVTQGRSIRSWARNLAIAIALVGSAAVLTGEQGQAVVTAGFVDPMAVLSGRSPGERAPGAVTQSKPRLAERPNAATERVLTAVRTRPVTEPEQAPEDMAWLPADREIVPAERPDLVSSGVISGELVDAVFRPDVTVPFEPTVFSPITGGGVAPPRPAVVPQPPVPGIPEPTTWLMMIAGFLAIGWGMRKRRAVASSNHRQRPA